MKCEHVEELIPLYVGRDLKPTEADDLRQHLTGCALCRRLNEEFQTSQNWLTTFAVPEFDEASLAKMRASVLSEIERQEKRGSWNQWLNGLLPNWSPRLTLAVSAAALVAVTGLSVAVYRNQVASPKLGDDQVSVVTGGYPLQITPGNQQVSTATIKKGRVRRSKPSELALLPREAFNNGGFSNVLEPPVIPEEPAPETVAPAEPEEKEPKEMLRIELQTADPNIRIIWLTPKPASPSNSKTK